VQVDEIVVQVLESFPVQVEVLIKGTLPDNCSTFDEIDQGFDDDKSTFWIEITTIRTTVDSCAQALVPFEVAVPLEVYGLPAGTYTVDVNGTRETFRLDVDNTAPEAGLPNPASVHCQEQGYLLEIRTDEQGNQYGVCIFPDGSECDEWAFFRGECGPAD
jgi:putative hemolysin